MTLNDYFDKIYYLNLAKDTDRNQSILEELAKYDITNFERVEGIVVDTIPDQSLWRNFNIDAINTKYILGSIGCRLTHIKAIKKAKEDGHKKVLILEDDIKFMANPNTILKQNRVQLEKKGWDLAYFGGSIEPLYRSQVVGAYAYAVKDTLFDNIIYMAEASGMEIDNFYAKVVQHMSYNYNVPGKYNVALLQPFNSVVVHDFKSNIRNG